MPGPGHQAVITEKSIRYLCGPGGEDGDPGGARPEEAPGPGRTLQKYNKLRDRADEAPGGLARPGTGGGRKLARIRRNRDTIGARREKKSARDVENL